MHQQGGTAPTCIALALAALTAVATTPRNLPDIREAIGWLLLNQGLAIDGPPLMIGEPRLFTSP